MAVMLRRQQPFPELPAVKKALDVAETDGFFLISGQQVGVCMGPLYTLIKAVALLALRDKLESELPGYRFVPLFWASGMDHDFEEIRHADFLGADGAPQRISINQPSGTDGFPCSNIKLTSEAVAQLGEMLNLLPPSAHAAEFRAAFDAAYEPGATLSEAFSKLIASVLAKEGLLVFNPEDAAVKQAGVELFQRSLAMQDEEWHVISARNESIAAAGGIAQVTAAQSEANLFLISDEGVREKLVRRGGGFSAKGSGRSYCAAELTKLVACEPSRISFGALMRPLFQQALFPTTVYMGGAGEVAYWAQMYPLFGAYGFPEPLLLPRPSFTLTNSRQRRLAERYSLELTDLLQPQNELVRTLAGRAVPQGITAQLDELEKMYTNKERALAKEAGKLDPGLVGVLETLGRNFRKHIATVRKKVEQSVKRSGDQLDAQVGELYSSLVPRGALQERSLNSLAALHTYGPGLVEKIRQNCEFPPQGHVILSL
jgi:bacillithiol biosynthesis cysteine-adding enzyme BshC